MIQMLGAVAPLAKILFNTIEKSVPDKDLQEKLKAQLQTQLLQSNTAELQAAAKIVEAEAKAGWFSASWRPLLMYVLIFILIWNYVLGPVILFFFKASITITLTRRRMDILQIGLGGYVVGRSAESVARTMANKPVSNKEQENG
jgi:hypothetical protein